MCDDVEAPDEIRIASNMYVTNVLAVRRCSDAADRMSTWK